MIEVTKTIYVGDDGTDYQTQQEAEKADAAYKEKIKNTTYWMISHDPDTTEGRGFQSVTYVKVYTNSWVSHDIWVRDYCSRIFGRIVSFVQGASEIEAWKIYRVTEEQFVECKGSSIGSYRFAGKKLHLILDRPTGLIIEPISQ